MTSTTDTCDWKALRQRIVGTAATLRFDHDECDDIAQQLIFRHCSAGRCELRQDLLVQEIRREGEALRRRNYRSAAPSSCDDIATPDSTASDEGSLLTDLSRAAARLLPPYQSDYILPMLDPPPPLPDFAADAVSGPQKPMSGAERQQRYAGLNDGRSRILALLPAAAYRAQAIRGLADAYFEPPLRQCGVHTASVLAQFELAIQRLEPADADALKNGILALIPLLQARAIEALLGRGDLTAVRTLSMQFFQGVRLAPQDFVEPLRCLLREATRAGVDRNPQLVRHTSTMMSYLRDEGRQIQWLTDPRSSEHESGQALAFVNGGGSDRREVVEMVAGRPELILGQSRKSPHRIAGVLNYVLKRLDNPLYHGPGLSLMLVTWADQMLGLLESGGHAIEIKMAKRILRKFEEHQDRYRCPLTSPRLAAVRARATRLACA